MKLPPDFIYFPKALEYFGAEAHLRFCRKSLRNALSYLFALRSSVSLDPDNLQERFLQVSFYGGH